MNRVGTCLKRFPYSCAEKLSVIRARAHVKDVASMAMPIPISIRLNLIIVLNTIETAFDIVLVISPGDPGHHVDAIAMLSPRLHSLRQSGSDAIRNGNVGPEIAMLTPWLAGLETRPLKVLLWINGNQVVRGVDRKAREKK